MAVWTKCINSLGKNESSSEFTDLILSIGETAQLSEDPIDDNDPIGHTKHYKYIHSGLEIGFRNDLLNHIHFYFDGSEGYGIFNGQLLCGVSSGQSEKSVTEALGKPVSSGGGKMDMLLGYINRWVRYELKGYALHLQFDQIDQLCRASLISSD
ncbi:hypothetical protein [Hafnia psychrotolerans]|uniref:Uncharacterized protein n=1 Tax=Hafnia psychrotolerans TaxID=1477018 RepID=A0ABQ1H286_9GAMM|nr:hypothetical protein [Hafnia psychrotolerans]GGA55382.1 hypothetical protein GCM10011328_33560 [Hafnia psychrotolerans]